MSKGVATHQIAVLGAIGKGHLSVEDLSHHLPIDRRKVAKAAGKLLLRGLVQRIETGVYSLTTEGWQILEFGLTIKSGPKGKRTWKPGLKNTFRQRAWKAMRLTKRFTIPEIVMLAADDKSKNPENNLSRYLKGLQKSGYVVELSSRTEDGKLTSNGLKVWRLIKDTGDIAPVLTLDGILKDLNPGGSS